MTFDDGRVSSTAPSAPAFTSATASPLEVSPDKPLRDVGESLGKIAGNLTQGVNQTRIKDFYYVFVQKVCSGSVVGGDGSDAGSIRIDDCHSHEDAGDSE